MLSTYKQRQVIEYLDNIYFSKRKPIGWSSLRYPDVVFDYKEKVAHLEKANVYIPWVYNDIKIIIVKL